MTTVSVIIPAYNAAKTILDTIISVQQQSLSDFELIIINDGSTDETLDLISSIEDCRIKIFSYENRGVSTARNRGISQATGDFITFLDADDLWTPDKLELQFKTLQKHPEAGVVYSWTLVVQENSQRLCPGVSASFEGNVYQYLLVDNFIASGSNLMLRRQVVELIGRFDPDLKYGEDWEYWLRVALHFSFVAVPKPQVLYRQSLTTASSNIKQMEDGMILVHERAFQIAPRELKFLKRQSLSFIYRYSVKLYLARGSEIRDFNCACNKFSKAIRLYPKSLLGKETQKLLFKIFLMKLLSPKVANLALQRITQIRATRIRMIS